MKKLAKAILLLAISSPLFAQQSGRDYNKPFSQLDREKQAEVRKLVKKYGKHVLTDEGGAYFYYKRWYNFWAPRIAPDGTYAGYNKNLKDYYDGAVLQSQNGINLPGNTDPWFELGPFKRPNNGIPFVGGGNGEIGIGLIQSITINRQNASKLLANSLAGGLFFSADKGQNWTNAGSDTWFRSGCSAAAFAPDNETTWYAGSNTSGADSFGPIGSVGGVYRTTNAGATWALIADPTSFPTSGEATAIHKILIDPKNPNIGYLATDSGLFKSSNINTPISTAVTWSLVHTGMIEDIEFRTDTSTTSTVIISYSSNAGWDIAKSTDQGVTWTSLPGQPSHIGTTQIVIEVSDAAPNRLYVLDRKATAGIWIYNFNSTTNAWTQKAQGIINETGLGHCFGVSNFDGNTVYVGYPEPIHFFGVRFAKSTNSGATFTVVGPSTSYHDDVEDIVTPNATCASCSQEVYVATHGGVNYSADGTATLQNHSNGLGVANCNGSASQEHPERIAIGTSHDGSIISSGTYGTWPLDWETVEGGDGGPPLIDYSDGDNVWVEYQRVVPELSSTGGGYNTYVSTSFGLMNDWTDVIHQNLTEPNVVYCPVATNAPGQPNYEDLYSSDNRGIGISSLKRLSDFKTYYQLPPDHLIFAIYPAPSDGNMMYLPETETAGWTTNFYQNKQILTSNSPETQWVPLALPLANKLNAAAVDLYNSNIVYFNYSGPWFPAAQFYRTDYTNPNNPVSIDFAGLGAGCLPNTYMAGITLERGSNGGIYVATDVGVFYTNNAMINWSNLPASQWIRLGTALPNVEINSMDINYSVNKIRVYTRGRGVWEHDLTCPSDLTLNLTGVEINSAFHETVNEITSTAIVTSSVSVTDRAGTYVQLNDGFLATPDNANFVYAFIHPCDDSGNSPGI